MAGRSYRHKRKPGGFDSYLLTNVLYHHAEKIERERKGSSPPVDGSETFKEITIPVTGIFSWECAWRQVEQRDGRCVDEEGCAGSAATGEAAEEREASGVYPQTQPNRCAPSLADRADYKAW